MSKNQQLFERHPQLSVCAPVVQAAYETIRDAYQNSGILLVCGNGGSAADSEHIVGELMKGFLRKRPIPGAVRDRLADISPEHGTYLADHLQGALPTLSLVSQTAFTSAYANDVSADMVFAQQVYGYGSPGDVLLAISTSGRSTSIINALLVGRAVGLRTIGLTGYSGGAMKDFCDVLICAPGKSTPEIQENHLVIYHTLCAMLEETFFSS